MLFFSFTLSEVAEQHIIKEAASRGGGGGGGLSRCVHPQRACLKHTDSLELGGSIKQTEPNCFTPQLTALFNYFYLFQQFISSSTEPLVLMGQIRAEH